MTPETTLDILLADLMLGLALLPLLLGVWNLLLYRTPPPVSGPMVVSVLIPARNEEANIAEAVRCVLASQGVTFELIVMDDASTDATPDILARIDDPRLRIERAPPLQPGWAGKQHACAALARSARHDLMVFLDADVRLAPDALSRMVGYMQHHAVGLGSGFPRQVTVGWAEQLLLPLIHFMLLGFLPFAPMQARPLPALGAGCGQLFITRRRDHLRAGGHGAIRASLHDGLTLPRAFRRAGIMTGLFDASTFADCRMYTTAAGVWEGLTKNATEGMATPIGLPVWTLLLGVGQVLPLPWLLSAPNWRSAAALGCGIGFRLLLALRFRQPIIAALLHPFGVLALLLVQWAALIRRLRGRPSTWRGRAYSAP